MQAIQQVFDENMRKNGQFATKSVRFWQPGEWMSVDESPVSYSDSDNWSVKIWEFLEWSRLHTEKCTWSVAYLLFSFNKWICVLLSWTFQMHLHQCKECCSTTTMVIKVDLFKIWSLWVSQSNLSKWMNYGCINALFIARWWQSGE